MNCTVSKPFTYQRQLQFSRLTEKPQLMTFAFYYYQLNNF